MAITESKRGEDFYKDLYDFRVDYQGGPSQMGSPSTPLFGTPTQQPNYDLTRSPTEAPQQMDPSQLYQNVQPPTGGILGGGGYGFGSPTPQQAPPPTGTPFGTATAGTSPTGGDAYSVLKDYQASMTKLSNIADEQQRAIEMDKLSRNVFMNLKNAGHEVKWEGDKLIIDGRPYEFAFPGAGNLAGDMRVSYAPTGAAPGAPGPGWVQYGDPANPGWVPPDHPLAQQQGMGGAPGGGRGQFGGFGQSEIPVYQPGDIGMGDIPNYTLDNLSRLLGPLTQVSGQEIQMDPRVQQAIYSLLQNPTAMDEHAVDVLQANLKDELAGAGELAGQDLEAGATAAGYGDSGFLQALKAQQQGATDEAMARGFRDIEMEALSTRKADERAAAGLGLQFAGQKASMAQQNVDNMFRSTGEKLAAMDMLTSKELSVAALRGDRLALREAVQQEAARSGQSAQNIMLQFTLAQMADLTERYGIDMGAAIDRERIAAQKWEVLEDIAFKTKQLKEELALRYAEASGETRRFNLDWELRRTALEHQIDEDLYNRQFDVPGV